MGLFSLKKYKDWDLLSRSFLPGSHRFPERRLLLVTPLFLFCISTRRDMMKLRRFGSSMPPVSLIWIADAEVKRTGAVWLACGWMT
jgi:hypothetical protein